MYGCVVQAVIERLLIVWTCYMLVEFLNTSYYVLIGKSCWFHQCQIYNMYKKNVYLSFFGRHTYQSVKCNILDPIFCCYPSRSCFMPSWYLVSDKFLSNHGSFEFPLTVMRGQDILHNGGSCFPRSIIIILSGAKIITRHFCSDWDGVRLLNFDFYSRLVGFQ